jgi:hypothetical protein
MFSRSKLFHGRFMTDLQSQRFSLTLFSAWLLFALAPTVVAQPHGAIKLKPLVPAHTHDSAVPRTPPQNKRKLGVRRRDTHIRRIQRVIAVLAVIFHGCAWIIILCRDRLISRYLSESEVSAVCLDNCPLTATVLSRNALRHLNRF